MSSNPQISSAAQPIKAVIFDMDGVLTDSETLINAAAVAMFKELGVTVHPDDFKPFVGTGEDRYIGGVAELHGVKLDLPVAKRRTYEIYLKMVPTGLRAFPGAVELVQQCRSAGLRVAVASSADRIKVAANLAKIGLPESCWDAVVTGEDVAAKKPAPDIFLTAAAKVGVSPESCVVVEDAVHGIQAARAAGMRCFGVAQSFRAELLSLADRVYPRIETITLEDLLTLSGHSALPASFAPAFPPGASAKPGGFWATLGLGSVVGLAWFSVQGLVAVLFLVIAQAAGREVEQDSIKTNGLLLGLAALASAPIAALLSAIFARVRSGTEWRRYLGLVPFSWKLGAIWTGLLLGLVAVSDLLTISLGRPVVPEVMVEFYETAGFLPVFWLALVVAAPVAEEFLFRGFLFEGLQRSVAGRWGAIILTSAVWASIHLQYDFYGIVTIFVFGLVLGWVRATTGSIYLTMWMHGLMNFIATVETCLLQK